MTRPKRWVPKDSSDKRIGNPNWQVIYTGCKYWSYRANDEYKPKEWIVETLIDVCSKGGNFQVGFGPTGWAPGPRRWSSGWNMWAIGSRSTARRSTPPGPGRYWNDGPQVRYTRSKDQKYVYAIALRWPGPSLRLTHVAPRPGTAVRLLGFEPPLRWASDGQGLRIDLPEALQDEARGPANRPMPSASKGTRLRLQVPAAAP